LHQTKFQLHAWNGGGEFSLHRQSRQENAPSPGKDPLHSVQTVYNDRYSLERWSGEQPAQAAEATKTRLRLAKIPFALGVRTQ